MVCTVVVGTAIRHSTRCAGRKRPRNSRHNLCCYGLQCQPRQRRLYRGQFLYSTMICKLVDLIPALHQSDCPIPNWVSAKTVLSSSTNHSQTTAWIRQSDWWRVGIRSTNLHIVVEYRNWPRYGLRWSGWYCNPAKHELCRPSRGRLRPRQRAQRVLFRIAVPTTTEQTV